MTTYALVSETLAPRSRGRIGSTRSSPPPEPIGHEGDRYTAQQQHAAVGAKSAPPLSSNVSWPKVNHDSWVTGVVE